jgi:hypothetical protein
VAQKDSSRRFINLVYVSPNLFTGLIDEYTPIVQDGQAGCGAGEVRQKPMVKRCKQRKIEPAKEHL